MIGIKLQNGLNFHTEHILNVVISIGIVIVILVIKNFILRIIHKRVTDSSTYHRIRRNMNVFSFVLSLLLISSVWLSFGGSLTTYIGIITAGLAVALKDLIANIAGWLFIVTRKPFGIGDRIEITGVKGDIIDQRIFQFSMMELGNWVDSEQSTGRIIHMPNVKVFTDHVANYTIGFPYIWNEINVLLTFESNWRQAKENLIKIADEHSLHLTKSVERKIRDANRKYMIYYNNLTPIIYLDVKESGVQLTLRYICSPHNRRNSNAEIWSEVMTYIENTDDVDLAYPTVRIFQTDHNN